MRSHAKASSAGPNSDRGTSRRSLPRRGMLAFLAVVLLATACLLPGSAFAAETRLQVESFGTDGTSSSNIEFPTSLAFDQGNKHLYALDQVQEKIYGFDASSPPTRTPLGGNFPLSAEGGGIDDLATDDSSHDLYFLSGGAKTLRAFDSAGNELAGNFPLGGFTNPCAGAVDPSGNIWVGDAAVQKIKEYDSAGNPLSGSVDTSTHDAPCQIAFDSQANLYVAFFLGSIWKYSASSGYTEETQVAPASSFGPSIAVDRNTDELYVLHPNHISVYDSSGAPLYEFGADVPEAEFSGIAIDQADDLVYVSDFAFGHEEIHVFGPAVVLPEARTEDADGITTTAATLHAKVNSNGKGLTDCHFEWGTTTSYGNSAPCVPAAGSIPADSSPHPVSADISGLSPGTTYHFRVAASTAEASANGADRVLNTPLGAPTVASPSVEAVGLTEADVSAKINPQGAKTTYHVEFGTSAAYGQSSAESQPIGFPGDQSAHTVSVHIGGLVPGTAYHFRFVATSTIGSGEGTDTSFATYPTSPGLASCPNDDLRTGFGNRLPDCRAYEQATPIDKHGANVQGARNLVQASGAGDRVTFYLNGGLPESEGSSKLAAFMASRGATGWSSAGLLAATEPGQTSFLLGWSEDLSKAALAAPGPGNVGGAVYLRDSGSGAFQPVVLTSSRPSFGESGYAIAGFAADTSHLIFENKFVSLAPGAATGEKDNLYELDHGTLTLAGRIPAGAATSCDDATGPACIPAPEGSFAGPYDWVNSNTAIGGAVSQYYTQNTISRNGSRIFFTTPGTGKLYVREDGAKTTWVSASQRTVPDPNGTRPAAFMAATPDGSKVFFTSCEKLTDDSTAVSTGENSCTEGGQGQDLYSYDVDSGGLTNLTVDSNAGDAKGAAVRGVLGTSEDGSYVYFAANGVLAPGASPGDCQVGGEFGACNVYLSHAGTTTFIASLKNSFGGTTAALNWSPTAFFGCCGFPKTARVSPDGRTLLFSSTRSLTGYDNSPTIKACGSEPCAELFRFSAPEEELECVSCNPTGLPPRGDAVLGTERFFLHDTVHSTFLTRNLSADGDRVFFDSPDALLPADTNGVVDVYEWEAKGSGSCETESQDGGCIYLISSGTSPDPSYFGDASTDGDHVFIFTGQQLVPSDRDQLTDVYDASVEGGLVAQHQPATPTCNTIACQANPAPPPEQTPGSASFSGPGNARQRSKARGCPKGKRKVRRAGKVSCQKAHKQHKRHDNRGGSK